ATISADGITNPRWTHADGNYSYQSGLFGTDNYPDRSRTIWQSIPVILGTPTRGTVDLKVELPRSGAGIAMEGAAEAQTARAGGGSLSVKAELGSGLWHVATINARDGGEFSASEIPNFRRTDAEFAAKAP